MSEHARPDIEAFRELEGLVRNLGEQLAGYRQRALAAEERLRQIDSTGEDPEPPRVRERLRTLEQENASLRGRLDAATKRTRSVLERVHFLRQQSQAEDR
ncbi:MAG TPA: hypothetical protein VJO33_06275 [Gemmatimonadaceae bacterium]|nr:hypothetical protein [Gemmatimonadaceae bacterium]